MAMYLLKRIIITFIVLSGVVLLTFCLMRFTDGDPATIIALDKYGSQLISREVIQQLAIKEGFNEPVYIQFWQWIKLLSRGDLGNSLRSGMPVMAEIKLHLPYTVRLAIGSVLISSVISIPLGIYTAVRPGSFCDRFTRVLSAIKVSIPNYYLAFIVILLFSVHLNWLPSFGSSSPRHYILPVLILVVSQIGFTLRIVRSAVLEIMESEYVLYAYLRGLTDRRILFSHVLKNALIPIVTYISLQFLMAMEGSIIVETIFAFPGIGKLFTEAIFGRDFTMIQGLVLFFGILIVGVNFFVDTLYGIINQKIEM